MQVIPHKFALTRKSPARRVKRLANRTNDKMAHAFLRWNSAAEIYEFGFELYDSASGMTYEVMGHQVAWQEMIEELQRKFAEATA